MGLECGFYAVTFANASFFLYYRVPTGGLVEIFYWVFRLCFSVCTGRFKDLDPGYEATFSHRFSLKRCTLVSTRLVNIENSSTGCFKDYRSNSMKYCRSTKSNEPKIIEKDDYILRFKNISHNAFSVLDLLQVSLTLVKLASSIRYSQNNPSRHFHTIVQVIVRSANNYLTNIYLGFSKFCTLQFFMPRDFYTAIQSSSNFDRKIDKYAWRRSYKLTKKHLTELQLIVIC